MKDGSKIISSKASIRVVLSSTLGTLFFGTFAYSIWTSKWNIAENTELMGQPQLIDLLRLTPLFTLNSYIFSLTTDDFELFF